MSTNTILCSTSGSVICLAGWLQSERDGPAVAVAESVRTQNARAAATRGRQLHAVSGQLYGAGNNEDVCNVHAQLSRPSCCPWQITKPPERPP